MRTDFSVYQLAKQIKNKDFYDNAQLSTDLFRHIILDLSENIAKSEFNRGISIDSFNVAGKIVYSVNNFEEKLVLRKIASNINISCDINQKNRNKIISELICYLKESSIYRIYRLDVSSFYESIRTNSLVKIIANNKNIDIVTKNIVAGYMIEFKKISQNGVPRGVEISSSLSELYMKEFDLLVRKQREVFYYSRFVDDILILTSSEENEDHFMERLGSFLPDGLSFNDRKTQILSVQKAATVPAPTVAGQIDCLGYSIKIIDHSSAKHGPIPRELEIDISKNKLIKIKTKITKSFARFCRDGDFNILNDRIRFMATNRTIKVAKDERMIPTGIFYNYKMINTEKSLLLLNDFVRQMIFSRMHSMGGRYILSQSQKRKILSISFTDGFNKKIFQKYSPNRMSEIVKVWR